MSTFISELKRQIDHYLDFVLFSKRGFELHDIELNDHLNRIIEESKYVFDFLEYENHVKPWTSFDLCYGFDIKFPYDWDVMPDRPNQVYFKNYFRIDISYDDFTCQLSYMNHDIIFHEDGVVFGSERSKELIFEELSKIYILNITNAGQPSKQLSHIIY